MFVAKAMSLGFVVCKPVGDCARYDVMLEWQGRVSRVQVKSCWRRSPSGRYRVFFGTGAWRNRRVRNYKVGEVDFIACYLAPEDAWFVIPIEVAAQRWGVSLTMKKDAEIARYREAWESMKVPWGT